MTQPTQSSVFRISQVLRSGEPDATVIIRGWVRTKREQKTFTFIEVNDGSSMAGLQVVVGETIAELERYGIRSFESAESWKNRATHLLEEIMDHNVK